MRILRGLAALALIATALSELAVPSNAQQFLGFGRSDASENGSTWRRNPYGYNRYRGGGYEYGSRGYESDGWQEDYTAYSTMCVRLCDGFYFPISHSVRRGRLYQDSRTCNRRCDGEARLFYYPSDGGSPETMVDMAGRPYKALPNAFAYRKSLVTGCTCKPAPWSVEAKARHDEYAAEAAQSKAHAELEDDDRIEREARMAQSNHYDDGYGRNDPRRNDGGYEAYDRPPPQPRAEFYSPWRRDRWDDAPYEALYDH